MTDIVTRLRDWRSVHLARLHLLMEEAADEMARLRSDNSRRANLEKGLRDGIMRLSANGDCPGRVNASNEDNTPATHATPRVGSEQCECTLTDAEREAVAWAATLEPEPNGRWTKANDKTWNKRAATLRSLLERLGGER